MQKKRGQLAIRFLVVAMIALIVLGVVVFIFYNQIGGVAKRFTEQREEAGKLCDILKGQKCETTCSPPDEWEKVDGKRCLSEDEVCCEKKKP